MTNWTKEELKMLNTMKDSMDFEDMAILLPNKNISDIKSKLGHVSNPVETEEVGSKNNDAYYTTVLNWIGNEERPFSIIDFIKDNNQLGSALPSIAKIFIELEKSGAIYKSAGNPNKYTTDLMVQNRVLKFLRKNRGQYFTTGPIYNRSGHFVPYMKLMDILETMVEEGRINKGIIKTNSIGYRYGKDIALPSSLREQNINEVKEELTKFVEEPVDTEDKGTFFNKLKKISSMFDKLIKSW